MSSAGVPARGRRIGIDVGSVRIGVAVSDPDGILASPVATVPRDDSPKQAHMQQIRDIVDEYEAVAIIVGLPRTLRGEHGMAAELATSFADQLRTVASPVPVVMLDERLSTVSATQALRASGVAGRKQRSVVDQAAAVTILQTWLDRERNQPQ